MFLASHRLPLPAASLARSVRSTGMHADKSAQQDVTSVDASNAATRDVRARRIVVRGELDNAPSIHLARGQALIGDDFSRIVNGVLTKLWTCAQHKAGRLGADDRRQGRTDDARHRCLAARTAWGDWHVQSLRGRCRCETLFRPARLGSAPHGVTHGDGAARRPVPHALCLTRSRRSCPVHPIRGPVKDHLLTPRTRLSS